MKLFRRRSVLLQEWTYAARYFYPRGRLPAGQLLYRWLAWRVARRLDARYRRRVLPLRVAPRIELLVPDIAQEYDLYLYRAPLLEAEFFYLPRLVRPGMRVLNIGANVGIYALALAQLAGPTGEVHAFEPAPETQRALLANLYWNQARSLVGSNVRCHQLALGDADGAVKLFHYPSHLQRSLFAQTPDQPYDEVRATTLDRWLAEQGITRVDLIWIDVEGAETMVLRGAAGLLGRDDAPTIVCEFNKKFGTPQGIWDLLASHGYQFWHYNARRDRLLPLAGPLDGEIYTHRQGLPGLGYGNVICVKQR